MGTQDTDASGNWNSESDRGAASTSTTTSTSTDTTDRARDSAARLQADAEQRANAVKQEAQAKLQEAQQRGKHYLEDRKSTAAGEISDVAGALRASADRLQQEQHDQAGRYVALAADGLDRFAGSLRERELGDLLKDAEQFARRQPGVFIGGAIAAGFMLSRFLKSSAERDYGAEMELDQTHAESGTYTGTNIVGEEEAYGVSPGTYTDSATAYTDTADPHGSNHNRDW